MMKHFLCTPHSSRHAGVATLNITRIQFELLISFRRLLSSDLRPCCWACVPFSFWLHSFPSLLKLSPPTSMCLWGPHYSWALQPQKRSHELVHSCGSKETKMQSIKASKCHCFPVFGFFSLNKVAMNNCCWGELLTCVLGRKKQFFFLSLCFLRTGATARFMFYNKKQMLVRCTVCQHRTCQRHSRTTVQPCYPAFLKRWPSV